ncbi:hypothetical protein Tco_1351348 [Tanacetum coccineum]
MANTIEDMAIYRQNNWPQVRGQQRTPVAARNQQTRTCYECGSLRHYKSVCPIVKFQNRMDMIHGRVMASNPKTMQDAIEIYNELMAKDQHLLDDTAGLGEKKEYAGTLPLCNKCKFHHNGQCTGSGHSGVIARSGKNQNHGKPKTGGTGARRVVLALGGGKTDQDPNNIKDEIEA